VIFIRGLQMLNHRIRIRMASISRV